MFILALCEESDLEDHFEHVRGFINTEVFPLVKDKNEDELMRFRAIWVLETFISCLAEEK
jgi:hypothetical protein